MAVSKVSVALSILSPHEPRTRRGSPSIHSDASVYVRVGGRERFHGYRTDPAPHRYAVLVSHPHLDHVGYAPMLSSGKDALGRPKKRAFGSWMLPVFRLLARLRFLRGTAFDLFGHSADRKLERDLIAGYEKDVATVLGLLSPANVDVAVELLSLPDRIRGYGPVKEKAVKDAQARYAQLAADLVSPPPAPRQIAAE